jgi:hypothetical protein
MNDKRFNTTMPDEKPTLEILYQDEDRILVNIPDNPPQVALNFLGDVLEMFGVDGPEKFDIAESMITGMTETPNWSNVVSDQDGKQLRIMLVPYPEQGVITVLIASDPE